MVGVVGVEIDPQPPKQRCQLAGRQPSSLIQDRIGQGASILIGQPERAPQDGADSTGIEMPGSQRLPHPWKAPTQFKSPGELIISRPTGQHQRRSDLSGGHLRGPHQIVVILLVERVDHRRHVGVHLSLIVRNQSLMGPQHHDPVIA